jgi:putative iron-regulated protein
MTNRKLFPLLLCLLLQPLVMIAASADDVSRQKLKAAVVAQYANILAAQYADSVQGALKLQDIINTFLLNPSANNLAAARNEWTVCRQAYSQSEVARFYDGPIEPLEEYINAWPIDLNYIDYTAGMPDSGIINQTHLYPQLTSALLVGVNQKQGENESAQEAEKAVSTGYHAIEFLLWGQDLYADTPGRRSYTDYLEATNGPGFHAERRKEYLQLLTQLLADQLQLVAAQWATNDTTNYCAKFLAAPADASLEKILTGVGNLSSSELAGERMLVPYTTKSQENEQCCFSDTTHLDLLRNEMGVQDVWLGRYTRTDGSVLSGPGLITLLETADPALAHTLRQQLETALAAIRAIPQPFDQAILGDDSAPGRIAVKKALDVLQAQNTSIVQAAAVLHLRLNLKN